ncbi:MAG: DUF6753 family protein [Waterburya sp.]
MSLPSKKAREILELCLANESVELRTRVYEIINLSGLDPDDPLFLVLALTGQIRVFLETAPTELRQLLLDWRQQNSDSLSQIDAAVDLVNNSHQEILSTLKQTIQQVSKEYISDIKEVGLATVNAIAEANSETGEQIEQTKTEVRELLQEITSLRSSYAAEGQKNSQSMATMIDRLEETTKKFDLAHIQIKQGIFETKKFQQQVSWARRVEWFTPLFALFIVGIGGGVAGGWLTARFYNSPSEQLSRSLVKWNQEQIFECLEQNKTQCPIKIVPEAKK